jgi:hypothetical protein
MAVAVGAVEVSMAAVGAEGRTQHVVMGPVRDLLQADEEDDNLAETVVTRPMRMFTSVTCARVVADEMVPELLCSTGSF